MHVAHITRTTKKIVYDQSYKRLLFPIRFPLRNMTIRRKMRHVGVQNCNKSLDCNLHCFTVCYNFSQTVSNTPASK